MGDRVSLIQMEWECKCHVVFIPKCRRKVLCKRLPGHYLYFAPPCPTLPPECAASVARNAREHLPWPFRLGEDGLLIVATRQA